MIKLVKECHKQISSRVSLAVSFIDVITLAPFAAWPSTVDCNRIEGFFDGNSCLLSILSMTSGCQMKDLMFTLSSRTNA